MIEFISISNTTNIISEDNFKKIKENLFKEYANNYMEILSSDNTLVCDIVIKKINYRVTFKKDHYYHTHINCRLNYVNISQKSLGFDKNLEKLKISLKNTLKNMVKLSGERPPDIIWVNDSQVLDLSAKLYEEIHKLENLLRYFIDISMNKRLGFDWWEKYVDSTLKNKYRERHGDFCKIETDLNDVNTKLSCIDVDDLITILGIKIKKLELDKIPITFKEKIENAILAKDEKTLLELLQKKLVVETDLWDKYYKNYFSESFKNDWGLFYKYRNHIAHNKLISHSTFETLRTKLSELENQIEEAINKFEHDILPDSVKEKINRELQEEIEELAEIDEYQSIRHERYIKEVESGVEILFSNEIEERIEEFLSNELMKIEELFYLRNDIEIDINAINFENDNVKILEVKSKINENSLEFFINNIDIDEAEGGESSLDLNIYTNNKLYKVLNIKYQNGEAEWDEFQSNYIPFKENEIIIYDYLEQFEELNEELNKLFPNLINEIVLREFENIKDGGIGVVSHLECDECGGEYLSIDESFLPIGTCASCGEKHLITQCNTCGSYYKIEDESVIPDMCENCYEHKLEKF